MIITDQNQQCVNKRNVERKRDDYGCRPGKNTDLIRPCQGNVGKWTSYICNRMGTVVEEEEEDKKIMRINNSEGYKRAHRRKMTTRELRKILEWDGNAINQATYG